MNSHAWGPHWNDEGSVTFRVWAPSAKTVFVRLAEREHTMSADDNGWYSVTLEAKPDSLYEFVIDGQTVPDPASRFQPKGVNGPSQLMKDQFEWTDSVWQNRPWEDAVIYELHVGTFSETGNYAGVEAKLNYLKDLGVTAIELMPLAAFDGNHGWGYDGVFPYAPHAVYGKPDDLRKLIDSAHQKGLMVFLDVVHNHFGPSGNYLHAYAKPFFTEEFHTPWGAAIDFSQQPVRDFFAESAVYWLREFHFDGLRFDAVHAITDLSAPHYLEELSRQVRTKIIKPIHLVLENDKNEAHYLGVPRFDAQWNDDIHHVFHVLATGETGGYYGDYADEPLDRLGRCLTQGFDYQGQPSAHRNGEKRGEPSNHLPLSCFVNFTQNHDQIGNRAFGERLAQLTDKDRLAMLQAILLLSPSVPLLFMGEEWASRTPFLYFCDFQGELANQVRDGRRNEFASFPEFADPQKRDAILDPNAKESFSKSTLNWNDVQREENSAFLSDTKRLLSLRALHLVPLVKTGVQRAFYDHIGSHSLELRWEFANLQQWQMIANFGDEPLTHAHAIAGEHIWGNAQDPLPPHSVCVTAGVVHA